MKMQISGEATINGVLYEDADLVQLIGKDITGYRLWGDGYVDPGNYSVTTDVHGEVYFDMNEDDALPKMLAYIKQLLDESGALVQFVEDLDLVNHLLAESGVVEGDTIYVGLDTSGSIFARRPGMIEPVLAGLRDAALAIGLESVFIIQFDTNVRDIACFSLVDPLEEIGIKPRAGRRDFASIPGLPLVGGGGTMLQPLLTDVARIACGTPAKLFIFSDLYFGDTPEQPENIDVTFVPLGTTPGRGATAWGKIKPLA